MINAEIAPEAVYEPFFLAGEQAAREMFAGLPCDLAAPSSGPEGRPSQHTVLHP